MIQLLNVRLNPPESEDSLLQKAARLLGIPAALVESVKIRRKSLDARKKNNIHYIYTLDVSINADEALVLKRSSNTSASLSKKLEYKIPMPSNILQAECERPVIVGFGPAGMFAGLVLAKAGLRPIILERGAEVHIRKAKVYEFWNSGKLDPECNVQFGEGGAGTFSDGKLNTSIKDPRISWVLEQFAGSGAPVSICYDAKPHIGTDILTDVVHDLRRLITEAGGEVRFGHKLTGLKTNGNNLTGAVVYEKGNPYTLECKRLILATGHSARDTYEMLFSENISMQAKAFSMGVRIEHKQAAVDLAQYGSSHPQLPPADYKLVCHLPENPSVYTFCMCPGGYVVAAASEEGGVVTNGMSERARNGENANSALLVTLLPSDFPYEGVLGGIRWQQEIERKAFVAGGKSYLAPAQLVGDFLSGRQSAGEAVIHPSYRPGVVWCDLRKVLPDIITSALEKALPELNRKLKGFSLSEAVMTAPETRSSSPVRILRNEDFEASLAGLYACGEGAGYAGGIMSSAVDGIRCAEAVINSF